MDQLGVSQRRCQQLQAELDEMRVACEQAVRAKRAAEQQLEDAQARINELLTINVNLTAAKGKLESEYSSLQADYDECSKELRVSISPPRSKNCHLRIRRSSQYRLSNAFFFT